jgi:hypothetical protein
VGKFGFIKAAAGDVVHHPAGLHHKDAVAGRQYFGKVIGNDDDAQTLRRKLGDDPMDFGL